MTLVLSVCNNFTSKLQKSSFMYTTYYKLCILSLISTKTVLDVCKLLHIMSFSLTHLVFMIKYDQMDPT
ncbi:hypothetical protein Hanom_Chr15g01373271 [Helianthus anomalus]